MASLADRVCETSVTTGTGDFTLAGAVNASYRTFAAAFTTSDVPYYVAVAVDANGNPTGQWECGYPSAYAGGVLMPRTTILSNSNGDTSPVDFTAGTKQVINAAPTALLGLISGLASSAAALTARVSHTFYGGI
jgi:hypothetical protein